MKPKEACKIETSQIEIKHKFWKISVSCLLKEFNQQHTDSSGHPNSATLFYLNEIYGMYGPMLR